MTAGVFMMVGILLGMSLAPGCDKVQAKKETLSDSQKWALATAAIPKKANGMELDIMGGGASDSDYVSALREMLKNDWEVADRASALGAIKALREEGHRQEFDLMLKDISAMDGAGLARLLADYAQDPELQKRIRLVHAQKDAVDKKSITAWDYCRLIYLAECSYRSGYITEQEAWQEIMPAAEIIQSTFSSWREMGDNYLLGREFWSGAREPRMVVANRFLLTDPKGPWATLAWKLPLRKQK
jgi:hypothetical protein